MHLHSHTRSTIESAPRELFFLTDGSEECFEIFSHNGIYERNSFDHLLAIEW